MQNFLRNGEAQNLYVFAPTRPCAHIIPAVFEEHYSAINPTGHVRISTATLVVAP